MTGNEEDELIELDNLQEPKECANDVAIEVWEEKKKKKKRKPSGKNSKGKQKEESGPVPTGPASSPQATLTSPRGRRLVDRSSSIFFVPADTDTVPEPQRERTIDERLNGHRESGSILDSAPGPGPRNQPPPRASLRAISEGIPSSLRPAEHPLPRRDNSAEEVIRTSTPRDSIETFSEVIPFSLALAKHPPSDEAAEVDPAVAPHTEGRESNSISAPGSVIRGTLESREGSLLNAYQGLVNTVKSESSAGNPQILNQQNGLRKAREIAESPPVDLHAEPETEAGSQLPIGFFELLSSNTGMRSVFRSFLNRLLICSPIHSR